MQRQDALDRPSLGIWVFLVAFSLVVLLGVLRLQTDWWFEDDTSHMTYLMNRFNPAAFFFDKQAVADFTYGRVFTPMLALSLWVDARLAWADPMSAYLHQIAAAVAVVLLMAALLCRLMRREVALAVSCIWLVLPSTISVLEFLSTRHYLEGLAFLLISLIMALDAQSSGPVPRLIRILAAVGCCFLAALCKELYVTSGFLMLACTFLVKKDVFGLTATIAGGVLYAGYRITMIGLGGEGLGDMDAVIDHFPYFLKVYPFIFTGSKTGYAVFGFFLFAAIYHLWRGLLRPLHLAFWLINLVVMAATIFPVSIQLYGTHQELGTWYRVAFLINTFLLITFGWLVSGFRTAWIPGAVGILLAAAITPGFYKTVGVWDGMKGAYRADAMFYLDNPDKLFYSRLPAPWFLPGVHRMYAASREPHFITWRMFRPGVFKRLALADTVWELTPEGYRENPLLHRIIWQNCRDQVEPLHQPIPQDRLPALPESGGVGEFMTRLQYGSGRLTLDDERESILSPPSTHFDFFVPQHDRTQAGTVFFLANDDNTPVSVRLTGYDLKGTVAYVETLRVKPLAWKVLTVEGDTVVRVEVKANRAMRVCGLKENIQGRLYVVEPVPARVGLEDVWLAHVPVMGAESPWRLSLQLANTGDRPMTVKMVSGRDRLKRERIQLQPLASVVLDAEWFDARSGFDVFQLMPGGDEIRVQAALKHTADETWRNLPMMKPSKGPWPVGEERILAAAFFNPNHQTGQVVFRAADDTILDAWVLEARQKLLVDGRAVKFLEKVQQIAADQNLVGYLIIDGKFGPYPRELYRTGSFEDN